MFIKLTNAANQFKGDVLIIRKDAIISVYTDKIELSTETGEEISVEVTPRTIVFSPHCSWQVEETIDQIYELLNS